VNTKDKLFELTTAIKDTIAFMNWAEAHIEAIDPDDKDLGEPAVNLDAARSELANASNTIDDAMGIIDELLAPEPGRPYDDPHLP
jgi:hypothetical protein